MSNGINVKVGGIRTDSVVEQKGKAGLHPSATLPLGMFDSGVGGLTVLKEIIKQLPHEDIIYFGDTARVPYGGRSAEEIIKFNREIINLLLHHGVKMIIMACGTSSAISLRRMQEEFKVPIIGLIDPGAKAALSVSKNLNIGIIATEATVASGSFDAAIKKDDPSIRTFSAACPLFVPLIEGDFAQATETEKIGREYLRPLQKAEIDTLILGCTHYPHLREIIGKIMGPAVALIDPAEATIREVKQLLLKMKLQNPATKLPHYQFLVSGSAPRFAEVGSKLLGRPITNVAKEIP